MTSPRTEHERQGQRALLSVPRRHLTPLLAGLLPILGRIGGVHANIRPALLDLLARHQVRALHPEVEHLVLLGATGDVQVGRDRRHLGADLIQLVLDARDEVLELGAAGVLAHAVLRQEAQAGDHAVNLDGRVVEDVHLRLEADQCERGGDDRGQCPQHRDDDPAGRLRAALVGPDGSEHADGRRDDDGRDRQPIVPLAIVAGAVRVHRLALEQGVHEVGDALPIGRRHEVLLFVDGVNQGR
mmetsp:Transcript_5396/g.20375  ORF Transcript_5396/g.20375 Transcript_5396/m.20375 type:complete len:242 (+) Transcript_5396:188-913(+)